MATVGDCVKSFVNRRVFEEVVLTVVCRQQELSKHNTKHNTTQHPCFLSSSLSPFLPLLSPFACFLPLLAFLVQNNSDSKSRTTPRFREKKKQQNQSPPPHTHTQINSVFVLFPNQHLSILASRHKLKTRKQTPPRHKKKHARE